MHTVSDLAFRYGATLKEAWIRRFELDFRERPKHEIEFLPANLELVETPPHAVPRWTGRIILCGAFAVILVGLFGSLDIVAIAPGQLVPNANVKVIQPAISGVVRRILVQNGERVVAGQLLIELDPTQASADVDRAKTGKVDAEFALARAHALLTVGKEQPLPDVSRIPGATDAQQASAQAFAEGALREHRKKMSSANAELKRRQAELETTGVEIAKLEETLSLARQQESDYAALAQRGYVAAHDYLDKQKTVIEQSRELEAQRSRAQELAAAIEEQKQDIEVAQATFAREQWERLSKATTDAQQTQDEETKAVTRHQEMSIRSPVAGVVQQLAVHTVGGVVTTAQSLLEVVPDDALEVEARISNRDIGFVDPGQRATVKIATFPYTRFGYLEGTVIKVSNDAISDKKNGLVFLARIRIPSNHFQANRKSINLSPGMEVTAEVKTGRQRVWQYFLSPLLQIGSESLRER